MRLCGQWDLVYLVASELGLAPHRNPIRPLRAHIHERNLQIPDDVALVAFDEMDWMFVMKPALTVVAQPVYEMGKTAAELLLARLGDKTRPVQEVVLQPAVKIRQSCAHHAKTANPTLTLPKQGGDSHGATSDAWTAEKS